MTNIAEPVSEDAGHRASTRRRAFGHGWAQRWLLLASLAGTGAGCNSLFGNITPGTDEGLGGADGSGGGTDAAGGGTESSGGANGNGGTDGSGGGSESSGGADAAGGSGTGGLGGADGSGGGPEPSVLGTVGEACTPNGAYACAGYNQRYQLECEDGEWGTFGQCSSSERCDTRESNAGLCEPIVTECSSAEPGDVVELCSGNVPLVCGSDRVTLADGTECAGDTGCLDGECEPIVEECAGKTEGDSVCSEDGSESFECGENLLTAENPEPCIVGCSDGVCVVPSSCVGLGSSCGEAGVGYCCQSPPVAAGEFYRGADTSYPTALSGLLLDKYEVTVGRFRKFKAAWDGGWRPASGSGKHLHLNGGTGLESTAGGNEPGWDTSWATNVDTSDAARGVPSSSHPTWTSSGGANETLPINYVNWYESYAFCIWDGGFLPSEAEWEYAAVGGDEERMYPWGEAALAEGLALYECRGNGDGGSSCSLADILAVGSRPAGDGRYGQSDLAGSQWEWNLDSYVSPLASPCSDCVNLSSSTSRSIRGGSWSIGAGGLVATIRNNLMPASRGYEIGLRCARAP